MPTTMAIPNPHMWQSASSQVLRSRRATASAARACVATRTWGSPGARSVHSTQTAATARAEIVNASRQSPDGPARTGM